VLVKLAATVAGGLSCDGVVDPDAEVLAYGSSIELGDIRCVSERVALSCVRTDTGIGFTLSRAFFDTHATPAALGDTPAPPPATRTVPADTEFTGFVTPTGSILCDIYSAESVTCFVWGHRWKATPYDEEREGPCDADFAVEVHLGETGPGETLTSCRSDSLGAGPVLGYGDSLRIGTIRCDSSTDGVTCRNERTRHGFDVNKARFRGF